MSDARISAYADALVAVARAEGATSVVEDELFRFARALEGSDELRSVLSDPHLPTERRTQVVQDLLGGRASSATVALVSMIVATGRISELTRIVDEFITR